MSQKENSEKIKAGSNLRGLLNDLKRRPEDAAKELDFPIEELNKFLEGDKEVSFEFISKACRKWPVNERDFFVVKDDTYLGIKKMTEETSQESSRIMQRAGNDYYEYRDTVLTTVTTFRPEWIKQLCFVEDNSPNNSKVQWNNGHFMHQFTYFIGDVNFYYVNDMGEKCVQEMNTGDSCYITPFVPHSFTTRAESTEPGLILALTFGSNLSGDSQLELSALSDPILASEYALNFENQDLAKGELIKFFRESFSISIEELSKRTKFPQEELTDYETGNLKIGYDQINTIAKALGINVRDLLVYEDQKEKSVINKKFEDGLTWNNEGKLTFVELANSSNLPFTRSLHISVNNEDKSFVEKIGLHQYIYNVGSTSINLHTGEHTEEIKPGDSCYVKPFLNHSLTGEGSLLSLRIGGKMNGDSLRELSFIGKDNTKRAISESLPWFNVKGKN
tara:strand:- start:629 stop:1972 length:1344 start_codon:yes stop_codon:yes gene_type:complete